MSVIAQELDCQLAKPDPETARRVEQLVRDALALAAANERAARCLEWETEGFPVKER